MFIIAWAVFWSKMCFSYALSLRLDKIPRIHDGSDIERNPLIKGGGGTSDILRNSLQC